jgi:hypothetical protein
MLYLTSCRADWLSGLFVRVHRSPSAVLLPVPYELGYDGGGARLKGLGRSEGRTVE